MNQQINLPAGYVHVFGLCDQKHIIAHTAKMQRYPLDAGVDLCPSSILRTTHFAGWTDITISTLIHMVFPPGTYGRITDRSSTSKVTKGATVIQGTIDAGYQGEILVRLQVIRPYRLMKSDDECIQETVDAIGECIKNQTAIAQIIMTPYLAQALQVVDPNKLPNSGRGSNGFGSTNRN